MDPDRQLQFVIEVARGAGAGILKQYGKVERQTKTHVAASKEAVTEADRASQRHIVGALRKQFPRDGIIGEEDDAGRAITFDVADTAGRVWVIDPIDGTNNFIAGLGNFAVCIGLLEGGLPTLGVVYDVTRDIVYSGRRGGGVRAGDQPVHVLGTPLGDCSLVMMTSDLGDARGDLPRWAAMWLAQTSWKPRLLGSAALEAVQVAAGVAHAAITVKGKLWDCCAPAALVLEAGGLFTDLGGKDIFPFDLRGYAGAKVPFLAGAPQAHARLLGEILQNS
jgi:fructose-1,6-bisphosphatase/inositol monophosphatase family enzyme